VLPGSAVELRLQRKLDRSRLASHASDFHALILSEFCDGRLGEVGLPVHETGGWVRGLSGHVYRIGVGLAAI